MLYCGVHGFSHVSRRGVESNDAAIVTEVCTAEHCSPMIMQAGSSGDEGAEKGIGPVAICKGRDTKRMT